MIILGAGILTWYYMNAISRQSRQKRNAQTATLHRAQGEMPLPALDGLSSLKMSPEPHREGSDSIPAPPVHNPEIQQLPLLSSQPRLPETGSHRSPYGHGTRKSDAELTRERLLAGAAFARESGARGSIANSPAILSLGAEVPTISTTSVPTSFDPSGIKPSDTASSDASLGALLRPSAIASARAKLLPTRRFLLPKGAFIDCTLETAIDSTLPGMTTCITATDTFGADGTVVLLERGTKLIGETRGQVAQGMARVFVLWTEARTPTGIVVPLDSPGADELGRSGLAGSVNRHFWDRFGAAILISTLDGAVQAAVQSASRGGGPVIYNPSGPETVATDVLKNSVSIPPTITKPNGDRIQVFVARDVDFRSVYELAATAH
jgi:type IV secretion system protein VirB10